MLCLEEGGTRKRVSVHRLVALAHVFNQNPTLYTEVNHKDENPLNNNAENLEWCDRSYNMHYGTLPERIGVLNRSRRKPVEAIKDGAVIKHYEFLREVCEDGYDTSGVWYSIHKDKPYKGLMWRYANAN